MRRAARIDDNHREVVEALRRVGCRVQSLATIGKGCPDLLVLSPYSQRLHLLELKDGRKAKSARKLTEDEERFAADWGCVVVCNDTAAALVAVGALKVAAP